MVALDGVTVFLTTHNLTEAEKLCQKIGVIRQSKLLAVGHPDELRATCGKPKIEIIGRGFTPKVIDELESQPLIASIQIEGDRLTITLHKQISAAPLVKMMVNAGVEIEEVRQDSPTLEEVFLNLMDT